MMPGWPPWACRPDYSGAALAGVWPAAARAVGFDLAAASDSGTMPQVTPGVDGPVGGAKGVVVLLADGLGSLNLTARRGHAPTLAGFERQDWMAGFPSTTVTSLGLLGTGRPPGLTALAGYSLRDPATNKRSSLIHWDTPTAPEAWQPWPTFFDGLAGGGIPVQQIGENRFADSAMSRCSLRGGAFHGAKRQRDRVPLALELAQSGAKLIYLYWGDLDFLGHKSGWTGPAWAKALELLDLAVADLLRGLPAGWEVWLIADHGVIDVTQRFDVAKEPWLSQGVDVVAGEPRALHLYTADPSAVAERWSDYLGEQAWVLTKDQAIDLGLFGQVDQRVMPYLGDVLVAMAGTAIVEDSQWQTAQALAMRGHHGSLTEQEMTVPFLRATV